MAENTDREVACNPLQDDDLEYLFGGGDDDSDSFFGGGDDDCSSLFTEDAAPSDLSIELRESESEATLLTPCSSPPEAANPSFQLMLPTLSSPQPSNTELALPLTLPQRLAPKEYPEFMFPTVPDPPDAPLSRLEGHTSGDPVVSTQNFAHTSETLTPLTAAQSLAPDDAALEAMLVGMWDSFEDGEEMVNTPSETSTVDSLQHGIETSRGSDDGLTLTLDQIPGFRYANLSTTRDLRLPRRIDHSLQVAESLVPYLTLSRNAKVADFFQALELDPVLGKRLRDETKEFVKSSPFAFLFEKRGCDQLANKKALTDAAFHMLANEGWGTKWFGPDCETTQTRTLFWPANSTLILLNFVRLLNKIVTTGMTCARAANRHSEARGGTQKTPEATPSRSPSVVSPPVYGTTGSSVTRLTAQQSNPLLDSLVTSAMNAKRKRSYSAVNPTYEVEIPDDAKLSYRVCVRDVADGTELSLPATYRHGSIDTTVGVYSYLKNTLEAGGHQPVFEILTPAGVRKINSEAEWDQAVTSVYNRRRSGGQVEVDIWV